MTRMSLADRRRKLIDAALKVIGDEGMAGATTRAIAAEAEMPLASFHYAFESYQDLMNEAITKLIADELTDAPVLQPSGNSQDEIVHSLVVSHVDDLIARPHTHRALFEVADYCLRTDGMTGLPAQWRAQRSQLAAQALENRARQAGVALDQEARAVADHLLVFCDGLTRAYLTTRDESFVRSVVETAPQVGALFAA